MQFSTEREAKEYLIGQIIAKAQREGVALTDIERKMLYFSETGWTLPDMMEVNVQFEQEYDNAKYEQKIAGLVSRLQARDAEEDSQAQADWDEAVLKLSEGDHYLQVLIGAQPEVSRPNPWLPTTRCDLERFGRPPGDFGRMLVAIAVLFAVVLLLGWLKAVLAH
jgi:hypothetical protein